MTRTLPLWSSGSEGDSSPNAPSLFGLRTVLLDAGFRPVHAAPNHKDSDPAVSARKPSDFGAVRRRLGARGR